MGKGKTAVITPLIVMDLQQHIFKRDVCVVLPEHLIRQSHALFLVRYTHALPCTSVRICGALRMQVSSVVLKHCVSQGALTLMSDTTIKTMRLNQVEAASQFNAYHTTDKGVDDLAFQKESAYFQQDCILLFDEVDTLMNPLTSELNHPFGEKRRIANQNVLEDAVLDIVAFLCVQSMLGVHETESSAVAFVAKALNTFLAVHPRKHSPAYDKPLRYYLALRTHQTIPGDIVISALDPCDVYNMHHLYMTLALSFTWICNKDYGLGDTMPALPKNSRVAIPYTAVNRPGNGSEFTDPVLGLVLTALAYAHNSAMVMTTGSSSAQSKARIEAIELTTSQLLRDEFASHRQWSILRETRDFEQLLRNVPSSVTHPDQVDMHQILDATRTHLDLRAAFLRLYLKRHVYAIYAFFDTQQYNVSFLDIVSSSFSSRRVGFSGTLLQLTVVPPPSPLISNAGAKENSAEYVVADEVSNGGMRAALTGTYNQAMKVVPLRKTHAYGTTIAERIIHYAVEQKYDVLIDAGAFLRDVSAADVAQIAHRKLNGRKHVIFIDEMDRLRRVVVTRDAVLDDVAYDNDLAESQALFLYYDHTHIVGIDIKQPLVLRGLTTINYFNHYTEIAQAVFRLRNLNRGHHVDYLTMDSLDTNRDPTVADVITFLEKKEALHTQQMQVRLTIQNLKVLRRTLRDPKEDVPTGCYVDQIFHECATVLLTATERSPLRLQNDWLRKRLCVVEPTPVKKISMSRNLEWTQRMSTAQAHLCRALDQQFHPSAVSVVHLRATSSMRATAERRIRANATSRVNAAVNAQVIVNTSLTVGQYMTFAHHMDTILHTFVEKKQKQANTPESDSESKPEPCALLPLVRVLHVHRIVASTYFISKWVCHEKTMTATSLSALGLFFCLYDATHDAFMLVTKHELPALWMIAQEQAALQAASQAAPNNLYVFDQAGAMWQIPNSTSASQQQQQQQQQQQRQQHEPRLTWALVMARLLIGHTLSPLHRLLLMTEENVDATCSVWSALRCAASFMRFVVGDEYVTFLELHGRRAWRVLEEQTSDDVMFAKHAATINPVYGAQANLSSLHNSSIRRSIIRDMYSIKLLLSLPASSVRKSNKRSGTTALLDERQSDSNDEHRQAKRARRAQ
jgi:hypothetical protein